MSDLPECNSVTQQPLREQTDELAIITETEQAIERTHWPEALGATIIYKIHRRFSWSMPESMSLRHAMMK